MRDNNIRAEPSISGKPKAPAATAHQDVTQVKAKPLAKELCHRQDKIAAPSVHTKISQANVAAPNQTLKENSTQKKNSQQIVTNYEMSTGPER